MFKHARLVALTLAVLCTSACLDDLTPDTARIRIVGASGDQVRVILSTDFVAGRSAESGATSVQVFLSDTVDVVLPVDTVISILPDRRFFIQAEPIGVESLEVTIRLDADRRNIFEGTGAILASDPWQFVYLFNTQLATSDVEVIA